jgi:hypothetical protein
MIPSKIDVDRNINKLRVHSKEFSKLSDSDMILFLQEVINNVKSIAYYWVSVSAEKKGITHKPKEGEEWIGGPFASIFALQYFIDYLTNKNSLNEANFDKSNNSYKVFPNKSIEKLLFPFLEGEIIFQKNLDFEKIKKYRGFNNRFDENKPKITLILGAGNVSSIPFLDALFHMIAYKSVIYMKLNPVNEYLLPVFEQVFEPFISRGYMVITKADLEGSKYISSHSGFNQIHLTGSNFTYEQIVYGKVLTDKERSLKTLSKVNKTPITSELGNVTPIIVHPDKWSASELKHQAKKIVTAKLNNSGFNCIAAQIIVLPKEWKQKDLLKKYIVEYLKKIGDTTSYYPGSTQKLDTLKNNKNFTQVNEESCITPFLISDIELEKEYAHDEAWSTVLFFKEIEFISKSQYVDDAINYVNNEVWGNLGVSVLIKKHKKEKNSIFLNKYVKNLNYGTVAINEWSALAFIIPTMPWGGYPGNKDNNIQSGQGFVHNSLLFESPLKGVVYSKFRMSRLIDPPWFVTHKKSHKIFKNLTYYQAETTKFNLIKLIFSTLV